MRGAYIKYARNLIYMVSIVSFIFGGFFDNSTIYGSANVSTPYINGDLDLQDDFKYNFGIRKIALYPYQGRSRFY